jgi:hypothetical protein
MTDKTNSQVSSDGLRYVNKPNGSPFGSSGFSTGTMSCFKCGGHKPRALGTYRRILNQSMFICGDCSPQKITSLEIQSGTPKKSLKALCAK